MDEATFEHATTCPHCDALQPLHTNVTGGRPPGPGDFAICWQCQGIARFADGPFGVTRRRLTAEEEQAVRADPRFARVLAAMAEARGPQQAARLTRMRSNEDD